MQVMIHLLGKLILFKQKLQKYPISHFALTPAGVWYEPERMRSVDCLYLDNGWVILVSICWDDKNIFVHGLFPH